MNNLLKTCILCSIFFFAASLKSGEQTNSQSFKHEGYFTASIDGRPFDTRNYEKYTAEISTPAESPKGLQGADLTFFGCKHYDQSGNVFEESLQFKYALNAASPTDISGQKIVFQFNTQKFISVPGQTKIHVTKVQYSADKTSMIVSADFEAKMTQWAAPGQPQPILKVKGKMENINISIPASSALPSASL